MLEMITVHGSPPTVQNKSGRKQTTHLLGLIQSLWSCLPLVQRLIGLTSPWSYASLVHVRSVHNNVGMLRIQNVENKPQEHAECNFYKVHFCLKSPCNGIYLQESSKLHFFSIITISNFCLGIFISIFGPVWFFIQM